VHLNVRFREPTVPVTDDGRSEGRVYPYETPPLDRGAPVPGEPDADLPALASGRGLIIAGEGEYDRDRLFAHAARLGWPLLATALSGMRGGPVVAGYHHLLAKGVPAELRPELVVAVGPIGPSPRLETLVEVATTRVRIDRWGRVIDPNRTATDRLQGDVNQLLSRIEPADDEGWRETWSAAAKETDARVAGRRHPRPQ
jgi:2-succinyl-5-enolpyruvyl-6-hydroxy-3-cyclohexene-1-carboxylate synthase